MVKPLSTKEEYEQVLAQLGDPELISDWERFEALNRKKSYLEKVIEREEEIKDLSNQIEQNHLITLSEEDPELLALAEVEITQLKSRKEKLEQELDEIIKMKINQQQSLGL